MNILKEFTEVKANFQKSSILFKIISVLGFFLSFSSLTSISNSIVEWKGFILDALNFYNFYYVNTIRSFSGMIGLSYRPVEIHVATVSSICMITEIRAQKSTLESMNRKYDSNDKPQLLSLWIIGGVTVSGLWIWFGLFEPKIHALLNIIFLILLPIFMTLPTFIPLMPKPSFDNLMKEASATYFKKYYFYLGSLFLVVCILAAINTGIHKSAQPKSSQVIIYSN
ncbi:hypothetical protein [Hydrogenovibrio kuenenii]|uniref:hypothetical protein n=1 Tax=Hydrogenovibrio kuenenii TaxID=63658 RepID=UPI0004643E7D|nr:hypothetical protein [Hydrogenovibrio kuenenii]